jgi:hypothetical protein
MKSKLGCAVGLIVVGIALHSAKGLATPATVPGFSATTLAKTTYGPILSRVHTRRPSWRELIRTKGSSDLYVQQNTWDPGACDNKCIPSTGWHTHPGPSFVIVIEGTLTAYDGDDPACTPHVYTAADPTNNAFVDPGGGHVHIVRNETGSVAKTIAVQLIPAAAERRQDAPKPANCSF